jgi:hypothetical protein
MRIAEMVKAIYDRLMDDLETDDRDGDGSALRHGADVNLANACRGWMETYGTWEGD